jgi:hypothetical protein
LTFTSIPLQNPRFSDRRVPLGVGFYRGLGLFSG